MTACIVNLIQFQMVILVWGSLECECYNVNVSLHSGIAQSRTGFVHSCLFTNVHIRKFSMSDALSPIGLICNDDYFYIDINTTLVCMYPQYSSRVVNVKQVNVWANRFGRSRHAYSLSQ